MNKSFFPKRVNEAVVKAPAKRASKSKAQRVMDCSGCGLDKGCISPRMEATGEGGLGILIIAEAPGAEEDKRGEQLIGKAGQLLRRYISRYDIDLDKDCVKINALNCRPPDNREPEDFEIDCCRQRVFKVIEEFKPKLILVLGNAALKSVIGHRWKKELGGINKWRGWTIPDRELNAWVCPTFHPSYILRAEKYEPVSGVIFDQDLERALNKLDEPFPTWKNERDCIEIIKDEEQAIKAIKAAHKDSPFFYVDLECNSRKPYLPGRKILTAAISPSKDYAFAFPMTPRVSEALGAAMLDPELPKGAQNMKFEDAWTNMCMLPPGERMDGWDWDSMIGANVLDNRKGTSGLKFQVYVNFGIVDYASHLDTFMDADDGEDDKDANALNKLEQAPIDEVLFYNGMDALLGRRLSRIQQKLIDADPNLYNAYNLFHDGTITMAEMEQNGMPIDIGYCTKQMEHINNRRIPSMQKQIELSEAVKKWKEMYGAKFNIGSDEQLGNVIVSLYGPVLPETNASSEKKRRYSVKESVLEEIEEEAPFVRDIVNIERMKSAATKLKGIVREAPDGWMHPFFNLGGDAEGNHVVTSYRGSSSNINFQNQPIRHEELKRILRTAFIPRPGMQRLSVDFKGIEVATSCCVHHDPKMIKYVTDERTNMHRDMAQQLMLLADDEWTKDCRDVAKNKFVFPEFYGSYWLNTATDIWKQLRRRKITTKQGILVTDHLANKGLDQFRCAHCDAVEKKKKNHRKDHDCCFENHVRLVEEDFWNSRFAGYTAWKKKFMREYERNGYFYLLTGFRVSGVLRRNQVFNLPIQGPAFHCLLFTVTKIFHRVWGIAKKEGWQSVPVGQIHDSGEMDVAPAEVPHIVETFNRVVAEELPDVFPWIIVPMRLEYEITPVDRPWYEKEELKL